MLIHHCVKYHQCCFLHTQTVSYNTTCNSSGLFLVKCIWAFVAWHLQLQKLIFSYAVWCLIATRFFFFFFFFFLLLKLKHFRTAGTVAAVFQQCGAVASRKAVVPPLWDRITFITRLKTNTQSFTAKRASTKAIFVNNKQTHISVVKCWPIFRCIYSCIDTQKELQEEKVWASVIWW